MIRRFSSLAWKSLAVKKGRTMLMVAGVVLSVALLSGTRIIIDSTWAQIIRNAVRENGDYHAAFTDLDAGTAGVVAAHALIEQNCVAGTSLFARIGDDGSRRMRLWSTDRSGMEMLGLEDRIIEGRLPESPGEIAIDVTSRRVLGGVAIGETISLETGHRIDLDDGRRMADIRFPAVSDESTSGNLVYVEERFDVAGSREYEITGILGERITRSGDRGSGALVFNNLEDRNENEPVTVFIRVSDSADASSMICRVADDVGIPSESIHYNDRLLYLLGGGRNSAINAGTAGFALLVSVIIVLATVAVIYNAFHITLLERIAQYGTLRCIGGTPGQIAGLILREAGLVCLVGIPLGLAAGVGTMSVVLTIADSLSSNDLFDGIRLVVDPRGLATAAVVGMVTVFIAAALPAVRAARIPAVDAVRSVGLYRHNPGGSRRRRHSMPLRGFNLAMAWRQIGRNRNRFAVTLFSMIVSVVLFVSFGGLLRLLSDTNLMYDPDLPGFIVESEEPFEREVLEEINALEGVESAIAYADAPVTLIVPNGRFTDEYEASVEDLPQWIRDDGRIAVPDSRLITYGEAGWELMGIDHLLLDAPDAAVLVNEGDMRNSRGVRGFLPIGNFRTGDELEILTPDGRAIPIILAGVVDRPLLDNHNDSEGGLDLIMTESALAEITGGTAVKTVIVNAPSDEGRENLRTFLDSLVSRRIEYEYTDFSALADEFTADFRAVELFFYGFMAIIAIIGGLNVVNTIRTGLLVRTRELGMLRAVGLSPTGMNRMIAAESLLISLLAWLSGSAVGSFLWRLILKTLSGVREVPFEFPWREIGISAAGLLIITIASTIRPLQAIRKDHVIENIREAG